MFDIVWILIAAAVVYKFARRNLAKGLSLSVALFVALPPDLNIATVLTVQRVILAVLAVTWMQTPRRHRGSGRLPFLSSFGLIIFVHGISMLLSISQGASVKDLLAFAVEIVFFFLLCSSTFTDSTLGLAALRMLVFGLVAVAVIALLQRYFEVNIPVILFSHFKYLGDGIQSTYQHRILLGYAMAMGIPIALALLDAAPSKRQRQLMWLIVFMFAEVCFLTDTRGGWIGMGMAIAISMALGTAGTRRRCVCILLLAFATTLIRPGIRDTILDRMTQTTSPDSYRGTSYSYRWILWHVAFSEISKSPERFLFGYGGLSTETMDLSRYFAHEEGGTAVKLGYTSWDNHYAADLIEFGLVGFAVEVVLYALVVGCLIKRWGSAEGTVRGVLGGLIAACAVYLFAKSNVYIFSPQLNFLFWASVAIGCAAFKRRVPVSRVYVKATPEGIFLART